MSINLQSPFFGLPLHSSVGRKPKVNLVSVNKCVDQRVFRTCAILNGRVVHATSNSFFRGRNVELSRWNSGSRRRIKVKCIKEPFPRSKALVRTPLLLLRCSVAMAVISGVCLLVWYGRVKAKGYIETKVLPTVCSLLSEHIQREIGFSKVCRVSPLSITLESCSIGPHDEEFSCAEFPTIKLCVRPFASLRKGKIVVDAILSHPCLLIAQKKDYTWLGIPFSEGILQRRLSTEEGIDYRTKARRIAREDAATRWDGERDVAAKKAAEMGYMVPEGDTNSSEGDKESSSPLPVLLNSVPSSHLNEGMHWRDHHRMDKGVEYDLKHSELEKSFGINIHGSELDFWSRIMQGPSKDRFKRKANDRELSAVNAIVKRNILECSALKALTYFSGLSHDDIGESSYSFEGSDVMNLESLLENSNSDNVGLEKVNGPGKFETTVNYNANKTSLTSGNDTNNYHVQGDDSGSLPLKMNSKHISSCNPVSDPFLMSNGKLEGDRGLCESMPSTNDDTEAVEGIVCNVDNKDSKKVDVVVTDRSSNLKDQMLESPDDVTMTHGGHTSHDSAFIKIHSWASLHHLIPIWPMDLTLGFPSYHMKARELLRYFISVPIKKLKSVMGQKVKVVDEFVNGADVVQTEGIGRMLPFTLDSVHFRGGTLMLLAYGDWEPREMENVNGHVKFQNHYGRVHVQLSGGCNIWRSNVKSEDGGWLSTDVFVDTVEQNWHVNLKVANLFVPLFERILEIPIMWSKGRASGEVHICMSRDENFPNLHGQLDATGLAFQIYDAPSCFSDVSSSLCFRGQRIFLHNTSGWFGNVPLEASGDFGIHPEEGEFHLMCQVPSVEVNALMKTFKMKPLLFPLAGSITAVFNCQGPLDAPVFVGSGMVSRKAMSSGYDIPTSFASEAMAKNREAGAIAAFDRIPLSYVSANFTFNTDNCVADLYGIRASLLDGGEIRGAGNAWICLEGEVDDNAMDVNFSGNLSFDRVLSRYSPGSHHWLPLKLGDLNGETKLSGSLLRPRFDIKWTAPKAKGSFCDARGDIIISHDFITINSSSNAFELYMKVLTSYLDEMSLQGENFDTWRAVQSVVEGIELDLRMRGFEFFSMVSSFPFDSPRPMHLKSTGRIKFQGKIIKANCNIQDAPTTQKKNNQNLVGEVLMSGLKLNQLVLAPHLVGALSISPSCIKLDALGRPDESLAVEVKGPLQPTSSENLRSQKSISFSLQKGQLKANLCYRPLYSADLEVRNLPLDELELASLRGTIQRAEFQLNLQKRRGLGLLSVLRPKFSGVLGEALDVAVRWSGDVITVEKTVLEQGNSRYELQGEYVLPGTRDRNRFNKERGGFFERAMTGHLGSVISSMGRWRMRLEVPKAQVTEMLPLARLLSHSTDPTVRSRSKDLFIQCLQSVGLHTKNLRDLLEVLHGHVVESNEVILEDLNLPGLAELRGCWHGSLDASGGGNGDTVAEFDFQGEDWEWGTYKTQHVLASGEYSNDDGLRLEKLFIQKDNATIHADGTLLGPKTNLHFAVLNFPVSFIPTLVQMIESSAVDADHSLRQLLAPIKGILHMEGDLRGSIAKPECDVQVRLLDGTIGAIDLGRAEIVASLTSTSRFLFNAKFEPVVQNGHVHIQGSVPVNFVQTNMMEEEDTETDKVGSIWIPGWAREKGRVSVDETSEKKVTRDRSEDGWDAQLTENLKGLNWNVLDTGEVRIDADIKDGGMMLLTALSPHVNWLHGNADIMLYVRGTVEQPVVNGSATFHRASMSSPILWKPLTNFGGTVHVDANRLCISSLESRVGRRGKLFLKGNLPLRTTEASLGDKIDLKCDILEVQAKYVLSGQVDTQMQITGSILQPNISGKIKLSHGEAYLPHDKTSGTAPFNRIVSDQSRHPSDGYNRLVASRYVSRFFSSGPVVSCAIYDKPSGKQHEVAQNIEQVNSKPKIDIRLSDLKLVLGPELRIVYPLILNFACSGELELNGVAHPKLIKPKGILTFENGDVTLVATRVRLKREHLNIAKFEPDNGLDPMLDLALVGSDWQFRIQSKASNWQDKLVVTSTRSVEQDVLSPTEAARVFESQLAESILEGDGQLAFKKLATATLERLMPRIEGKGEFGQARWRLVYAPQIPSLRSVDPSADPLKSLASSISFGTEVEVQLGKRLQASIVRQMKDAEMAMQWTLIYQLTSRLRVLLQSSASQRLIFEYAATSQD